MMYIRGSSQLKVEVYGNNIEGVRSLLDDAQVPDKDVQLAFASACVKGNSEIVKLFLECKRNIDYNATDRNKWTVVHLPGSSDVLKMLLADPRINVDVFTEEGNSPLDLAVMAGKLEHVKHLLASTRYTATCNKNVSEYMREKISEKAWAKIDRLLLDFEENPVSVKERLRAELYPEYLAGELFAIVVLLCDDYLKFK